MTITIFQSEAIVIESFDFKEQNKIITLFSKEQGLIKLFVKMRAKQAVLQQALTSVLTEAEFLYQESRSDLFFFRDATLIKSHYCFFKEWENISAAKKITSALLQSQWQGKSASQLYTLFRSFLIELYESKKCETLIASFLLKLLKYEGMIHFGRCSACHISIKDAYRIGGECFCKSDSISSSQFFSQEEEECMHFLTDCRSLKLLSATDLPNPLLFTKLETLFCTAFN